MLTPFLNEIDLMLDLIRLLPFPRKIDDVTSKSVFWDYCHSDRQVVNFQGYHADLATFF